MANVAVFFDRDGTLIHDPGYLNDPDQVQVLDGVAEGLRELGLLGYQTVVATNQSGVARGLVTPERLEQIHDRLRELLAARGATLDAIYCCPYHPEGTVPEYRKDSDWRKPRPGMLLAAARELDLDLSHSWMIGDNDRDVEAGRSAGCKTILLNAKPPGSAPAQKSRADFVAVNLREAVNIIKRYRRDGMQDRRMTPAAETKEEPNLATQSAEILSMSPEPAAGPPAAATRVASVSGPSTRIVAVGTAAPWKRGSEARDPAPAPPVASSAATEPATDQILQGILEQLRRMQKEEMFGEFSLIRLLAGVVQGFVPFCLLLALWFLMGPSRQDSSIFLSLGFAAVLQMMALTFYLMHGRR